MHTGVYHWLEAKSLLSKTNCCCSKSCKYSFVTACGKQRATCAWNIALVRNGRAMVSCQGLQPIYQFKTQYQQPCLAAAGMQRSCQDPSRFPLARCRGLSWSWMNRSWYCMSKTKRGKVSNLPARWNKSFCFLPLATGMICCPQGRCRGCPLPDSSISSPTTQVRKGIESGKMWFKMWGFGLREPMVQCTEQFCGSAEIVAKPLAVISSAVYLSQRTCVVKRAPDCFWLCCFDHKDFWLTLAEHLPAIGLAVFLGKGGKIK